MAKNEIYNGKLSAWDLKQLEAKPKTFLQKTLDRLLCAPPLIISLLVILQYKTLKPDDVITHGRTHGQMAKLGVPSVQLFSVDGAFFAYAGFYQILRKIDFALTNINYQKRLAEHTRQPYKDWYWEADTYAFIKD